MNTSTYTRDVLAAPHLSLSPCSSKLTFGFPQTVFAIPTPTVTILCWQTLYWKGTLCHNGSHTIFEHPCHLWARQAPVYSMQAPLDIQGWHTLIQASRSSNKTTKKTGNDLAQLHTIPRTLAQTGYTRCRSRSAIAWRHNNLTTTAKYQPFLPLQSQDVPLEGTDRHPETSVVVTQYNSQLVAVCFAAHHVWSNRLVRYWLFPHY